MEIYELRTFLEEFGKMVTTRMMPLFAVFVALAIAREAPCGGPMVSTAKPPEVVLAATSTTCGGPMAPRSTDSREGAVAAGPAGTAVAREPVFGGSATTLIG